MCLFAIFIYLILNSMISGMMFGSVCAGVNKAQKIQSKRIRKKGIKMDPGGVDICAPLYSHSINIHSRIILVRNHSYVF